jgi:hypothetical protein
MDKYVLTALALDESKALAGVKPLHCSLFFAHCCVSFQELSYLVLRYVLAAFRGGIKQKSRKSYLADLYEFPKAIQEQQTQQESTTVKGKMQGKSERKESPWPIVSTNGIVKPLVCASYTESGGGGGADRNARIAARSKTVTCKWFTDASRFLQCKKCPFS